MTEDEAKTKWCPFASARVVKWDKAHDVVVNAVWADAVDGNPTTACIASACMAWRSRPQWRWNDVEPPEWFDGIEPQHPMKDVRMAGYCGLAGAPR